VQLIALFIVFSSLSLLRFHVSQKRAATGGDDLDMHWRHVIVCVIQAGSSPSSSSFSTGHVGYTFRYGKDTWSAGSFSVAGFGYVMATTRTGSQPELGYQPSSRVHRDAHGVCRDHGKEGSQDAAWRRRKSPTGRNPLRSQHVTELPDTAEPSGHSNFSWAPWMEFSGVHEGYQNSGDALLSLSQRRAGFPEIEAKLHLPEEWTSTPS
jgi:hypothetical protein